jgi:phosphate transport system permease protein
VAAHANTPVGGDLAAYDPTSPLVATGNLRRRLAISRVVQTLAMVAAAIAVGALGWVTFEVIKRGVSVISWSFLTTNASQFGGGGGIGSEIIGSALIVGAGALIAAPLGVLCAIYLVEFASRRSQLAKVLQTGLDMMQGFPTVVIGLFIYSLVSAKQSGFAGSLALSMVMLPLIARTSQEVLLTIPGSLREATDALGIDRWRSILTVILPTALGGILTGTILAVARAAGETAPLLIVDGVLNPSQTTLDIFGHGVPNLPLAIWEAAESPTPDALARVWGIALVLLGLILIANIGARLLLARSRRRMGL